MVKIPEHHVLNFFYDNDNGCALTVWVKGSRYHIIAEASRLQDRSKRGKRTWRTYARLLDQVKAADQDDGQGGDPTAPLFVQPEEDEVSDDEDHDSGVSDMDESEEEEHESSPTEALQKWMLKPLVSSFPDKEPKDNSIEDWYHCPTFYCDLVVKDGKVECEQKDSPSGAYQKRMDALIPEMTLPKYINDLKIPVYSAQDVTVIATSADPAPLHPALVRVDGKELFLKTVGFGAFQPMVKRELQVMKQVEAEGLHNEIRVPLLKGLVHFGPPRGEPTGKQHIMGFVIDPIQDPTPLTHMLNKDISEEKRQKWADEAARMVDLLHQHNIVWGDSKGDNFMVDANEDLWIIDFGGSYTEGWVDPELRETEEGDKQGLRKLQNGLQDPENYTLDGDEEAETEQDEGKEAEKQKRSGSKRKHDSKQDEEESDRPSKQAKKSEDKTGTVQDESHKAEKSSKREHSEDKEQTDEEATQPPTKQQKKEQDTSDDAKEKYCYCDGPDSGRMLACDNKDCKRQWFHFDCIGIVEAPSTKKWYCEECKPTHNPRRSEESCYGTWDAADEEERNDDEKGK